MFDVDLLYSQLQGLQNRKDGLIATQEDLEAQIALVDAQILTLQRNINYVEGGNVPAVAKITTVVDFIATATAHNEITLGWTAKPTATKYEILYTLDPFSTDYETLITLDGTNTISYVHENLTTGVTYFYRIIAKAEGSGNSEPAEAAATALAQLGQVVNFNLTPGDGEVTGAFDILPDAVQYLLYKSETNDFGTAVLLTTLFTNSFADTDVVNENEYFYWLIPTAINFVAGEAVTDSATPTAGE